MLNSLALTDREYIMGHKKLLASFKEMFETFKHEITKELSTQREFVSAELKSLKDEIARKNEKIEQLEKKVDDLEQYTRRENVVITGLTTKKRSYANSTKPDRNLTSEEVEDLETQVLKFMSTKGINIKPEDVSDIHPLRSNIPNRPALTIIRFVNRKKRNEVLRSGQNLKGTNVYINEHLASKNQFLAKQAKT